MFWSDTMKSVELRLFSTLQKYNTSDKEVLTIDLKDEACLEDVYRTLHIPGGKVAVAMVNGHIKSPDYCLRNGDRVGLFSPIAGG